MMHQATQRIYEALSHVDGLKVFTDETDTSSYVWLQFSADGGGSYRIRFISRDEDNDVAVRVIRLISNVPEAKRDKMALLLNKLNCEYRYVKFSIDDDGDVNVAYDFPVHCTDPAESAREIVVRFTSIIDDTYGRMMQALWA